jgi:hypothetical protein
MATQVGFHVEHASAMLNQVQQLREVVQQDWSSVMNQWGNLQSSWSDQQYEQFYPLFEQLAGTYNGSEQACENFASFLQEQIRIADDRRSRMGNLAGL